MNASAKKELKMRKLSKQEIGNTRMDFISMFADSTDPFAGAVFSFDMEPCLACAREASERYGRKITFAHVLVKLLAVAIDENPVFNQVLFGRSIYQIEGVHISNLFMLPVKELVLTPIVLDNPNLKTLAEIQQDALMKMVQKTREHAVRKNRLALDLAMFFYRLRLNRLISERLAFTVAFNKSLGSNIVLSNHDYGGGPSRFSVVKTMAPVGGSVLRIHACTMGPQPFVDKSGAVVSRETMKLTIIGDHRVLNGVDSYRLGQSLYRLFENPEHYLL